MLYNELQSMKRNDKEWTETVEKMKRILRHLEALGENLDHCSIQNIVKSRFPRWILERVDHQKATKTPWSTAKLRKFLDILTNINVHMKSKKKK